MEQVLRGMDAALEQGLPLKLNAVLQRGVNEGEWQSLIELAREKPLDVRFIEMMPIGGGRRFPTVSNLVLRARLEERYGGLETDTAVHGNGPAVYVSIPGFMGSVGFISAIHGKFCSSCNRVRLTSTGFLKGCLCYGDGEDLRAPLRQGEFEEVQKRFARLIASKPEAHCFEQVNQITEQREMSKIGG
jgi:cyclic pyranopterin phosphate synthase